MRISNFIASGHFGFVLFLLLLLNSCAQDAIDFNDGDSQNVENESTSDAYFSESEDLTSVTVSSDAATAGGRIAESGRVIVVNDPRLVCAIVTIEPDASSTLLVPKGVLRIDFGAGCTDSNGNVRKGLITIAYRGRRFMPASSVVTTLAGYEVNGVKIEGERTVTNASNSSQSNPVLSIVMAGGKITWPDGTSTTRDESSRRELILGATPADRQWRVTGSATGQNREGIMYAMKITDPLVYKRSCAINNQVFVAVAGTKELVVNNKKITVEYGDGTCDKLVTVSIRSKSKVVELNGH